MSSSEPEIRFLNVDLEVRGPNDLQPIIDDLGDDVVNLHAGRVHDHYIAIFEANFTGGANELIEEFCRLIETLEPDARRSWDEASSKTFDLGYEAGHGARSYESTLRPETVAAVARVGGAIRVTIYPPSTTPVENNDKSNR